MRITDRNGALRHRQVSRRNGAMHASDYSLFLFLVQGTRLFYVRGATDRNGALGHRQVSRRNGKTALLLDRNSAKAKREAQN
uniref:hypothetical protein n=1 Tax=Alistipes sp. TaxID=1872444 RepID=UPI004055A6AA